MEWIFFSCLLVCLLTISVVFSLLLLLYVGNLGGAKNNLAHAWD